MARHDDQKQPERPSRSLSSDDAASRERHVPAGQNEPAGGAPDPSAAASAPASQGGPTRPAQTSEAESALGLGGPLAPTEDAIRPLPGVVPEDESSRLFYEMRALGLELRQDGTGKPRLHEPGPTPVPQHLRDRIEKNMDALAKAWGLPAGEEAAKASARANERLQTPEDKRAIAGTQDRDAS